MKVEKRQAPFHKEQWMKQPPASDFMLEPEIVYLNHGSFGACPRPVFETYQRWQLMLERQPVRFLGREIADHMSAARAALAAFVGCKQDDIVYFTNPTTALNTVARSLDLQPGDEILTTDHEYGALDRTWRFICAKTGAVYRRQPIPLPIESEEQVIETLWRGVTERTRAIFISHITSPTALRFPVKAVCRRARRTGLLTIVDGAHAPGQISLDMRDLGADFYAGACHKWLCAPKGSAFLYARRQVQHLLEPLVVSWGWEADEPGASTFVDHHQWQGTRDPAAFLTVPDAIAYQRRHDWPQVRTKCHELARSARARIQQLTGLAPICPDSTEWYVQMFAARLPQVDAGALQRSLYERHRVEVVVHPWEELVLLRVSIQAYNDEEHLDILLQALRDLLPYSR
jgi:isopenicillin-N epimerase